MAKSLNLIVNIKIEKIDVPPEFQQEFNDFMDSFNERIEETTESEENHKK